VNSGKEQKGLFWQSHRAVQSWGHTETGAILFHVRDGSRPRTGVAPAIAHCCHSGPAMQYRELSSVQRYK